MLVGSLLGLALLAYLASGFYTVSSNEVGVQTRFGAVVDGSVQAGLRYRIPWPIDRVFLFKAKKVHALVVSFWTAPRLRTRTTTAKGWVRTGRRGRSVAGEYCITSDRNMIHVKAQIQYTVVRPDLYLFGFARPRQTVKEHLRSLLTAAVAAIPVDEALTVGKGRLAGTIRLRLADLLGRPDIGISLISLQILAIDPPAAVRDAFQDVNRARIEKSTTVHRAEQAANRDVSSARMEADRVARTAETYRFKRVSEARTDVGRIEARISAVQRDPYTALQIYLEVLDEILRVSPVYVVPVRNGRIIGGHRVRLRRLRKGARGRMTFP